MVIPVVACNNSVRDVPASDILACDVPVVAPVTSNSAQPVIFQPFTNTVPAANFSMCQSRNNTAPTLSQPFSNNSISNTCTPSSIDMSTQAACSLPVFQRSSPLPDG